MIMSRAFHSCLLIAGLIALSVVAQAKPVEITLNEASRCISIGHFTGGSGYGKNPGWKSIANTYAERSAENGGATHVVPISSRQIGAFNGEVTLAGYRCEPKQLTAGLR